MQARQLCLRLAAALATLAALSLPASALFKRRTCFCDLRLGRLLLSDLLLDVPDPTLQGLLLTCRRVKAWCPDACRRAARAELVSGGAGDVAPLTGAAGVRACAAAGRPIAASDDPVHVYATFRVSNCGRSGSHYFGRLCCREEADAGGGQNYTFNEACRCDAQGVAAQAPRANTTEPVIHHSAADTVDGSSSAAEPARAADTVDGSSSAAESFPAPDPVDGSSSDAEPARVADPVDGSSSAAEPARAADSVDGSSSAAEPARAADPVDPRSPVSPINPSAAESSNAPRTVVTETLPKPRVAPPAINAPVIAPAAQKAIAP